MTRALALLLFGGLVAALFLTASPSATRLAAAESGKVLLKPVGDLDALAAFPRRVDGPDVLPLPKGLAEDVADEDELKGTLLAALLESPAVRALAPEVEGGRERLELRLGGAQLKSDEEGVAWDPMWPGYVRESMLRQIRSVCEGAGVELIVVGLKTAVKDGVSFDTKLALKKRTLATEMRVADSSAVSAARTWRQIDQLSLLPPLVAIFLAILLRKPIVALFAGLWSGAALIAFFDRGAAFEALAVGLKTSATEYLYTQLVTQGKLQIVLFVVFMLAMVGVITRAGGIQGIMERLSVIARDARRTQIATWFMGLAIFFDDYANTILVGSTMRPITDKFKIAREKLAYIVDSTAAPVAGISILSTWIAFEVSTFSPFLPDAELSSGQGYAVFVQTLPYRFYCILTIVLVGLVVFTGRDFGPMLRAERRARGGQVLREGATPMVGAAATRLEAQAGVRVSAITALVPLALFIGTVLGLIAFHGGAFTMGTRLFTLEGATQVLSVGSGNDKLMWGALVGFAAALLLGFRVGLGLGSALSASFDSLRSMGVALVILYLAWALGAVCEDLGTATFLAVSLGDTLPWMILPTTLFLLSGVIAFSTGSSWSTMTILLPLVVGLAYRLGFDSVDAALGFEAQRAAGLALLVISIGAVLEGAIWGDHCSPISDTTVMSSIASASDHIDHVRTQMPYALLAMVTAIVCGYFPATFLRWNPFVCLALGITVMTVFLMVYGERAEDSPKRPAESRAS